MFSTFQQAYNARATNCNTTTTFRIRNSTTISVGSILFLDVNATITAGTGFAVGGDKIYTILNGTVTSISNYP